MRSLFVSLLGLILVVSACSSTPIETGSGAQEPIATTSPDLVTPTTSPTPLVIPSAAASATATAVALDPTPTATARAATATPVVTRTAVATAEPSPTATPRPIPTTAPTAIVISPTPRPIPTATPRPIAPTPTPIWVNPDCYVGPGAADEPVWWCGGKICVVGAAHHGCPTGQPIRPFVRFDCTISDTDIAVDEIITLTAVHEPANAPVRFAFAHGDGTVDNTAVSRAYYEAPGAYRVTLLWQYAGGKGTTACGTVHVHATGTPTPTPTPAVVQIGCSIAPRRNVQVDERLTFTAFQSPANVPVSYVFDHGDGTLDETSQSHAYYAAPGYYDVRLRWAHGDQSGTTFCGTVTVEPNFSASDFLGRTPDSAAAFAANRGLTTRVVRIDDEWFVGTDDYRLDRVNLEIDANKVTKAYLG